MAETKQNLSEKTEGDIKILPDNLTNKIAAGEVVDRPASVVKELVENSLDSGASEITIILKEGGKSLIQVVDNGSGMNHADILLAFQRHATSKIFTYNDLLNITTLGFRGEALASISSVAQVDARSVLQGASNGHRLVIDGGVMHNVEVTGGNPGTSISVRNLFFNTPARRKFLKTTPTEYRQIVNVLSRFYLAHPNVSFTFVNEDEVVTELHQETLHERIGSVFGDRIQKNLLEINNDGPVKISGYVGNQDAVRRSRGDQYMYYNRRFFTSKNLNYAVVAAYGEILPRGSFPVYVIFIEMEPEHADVNVHPTKMEIKFANDSLVFSSIRSTVKRALTSQNVVPEFRPWHDSHTSNYSSQKSQPISGGLDSQLSFDTRPDSRSFPGWPESDRTEKADESPRESDSKEESFAQHDKFVFERKNIWQVHNKYIISQIKNGLIVVDQHVAHERILFEQALANFEKRKPSSQQLLFPQVIEMVPADYSLLLEILPFLEHIGFVVKAFGKNTVVVEGVPSGLKIHDDEKILLQILDEYKRGKHERTEIRENIAASYACHAAVRAGDPLSLEAMNALIDQLFSTKEPYFCPHGRPVIIHISIDELDKRFKRH